MSWRILRAAARAVNIAPLLAGAIIAASGTASATPLTDPINDFVPSFLGPHNADLDVVSAEVFLDPNNFILHAVLNGPVGTTPGGFYVWGFNRGAGTQGLPIIAPGVLFDRVVLVRANGTTNAPGGTVLINGNEITGLIPRAFMPSTGFFSGGLHLESLAAQPGHCG